MPTLLILFSLISYSAATLLIAMQLRTPIVDTPQWNERWMKILWAAGLLAHAAVLSKDITDLHFDFFHAASTVAFLITLLLFIASLSRPLEMLGLFALPAAVVALLVDWLMPDAPFTSYSNAQGLELHIFISLLAYSLLSLAAVQAVVLALQNRQLHNHQPGGWLRYLPPLTHMESLLFKFILSGFVLLTAALATGFIFLEDIFAQHQAHKTLLSIAAWIIFAVLLFGHWRWGWRGRIAVRWTLTGFGVLLVAYFGSKLVLELILN